MRRVTFDPAQLTGTEQQWWQAWTQRAEEATGALIAEWERWIADGAPGKFKPEFDDRIWKDLRDWLLEHVFDRKCAYCETPMVRARHHGEHFRPKGQVRVRPLGERKLRAGMTTGEWLSDPQARQQAVVHPGYFWLAYHWKNLVPACEFCNSSQGKKDQFPVGQRHVAAKRVATSEVARLIEPKIKSPTNDDLYYLQPDDLDALEERLLLHPYVDDPADHLVFSDKGVVAAKADSPKGQHSIAVYDLNAEEIVKARFDTQTLLLTQYLAALSGVNGSAQERRRAAEHVLTDYRCGKKPYSAAVLANIRATLANSPLDPDLPLDPPSP